MKFRQKPDILEKIRTTKIIKEMRKKLKEQKDKEANNG